MHRVGSRVGYIGVINVKFEVFGKYISLGMQEEISRSSRKNIPIRYFNEACQEVTE